MESVIKQLILGDWLKAQHARGARTFSLMITGHDEDSARIVILGLDRLQDANSAWDIDGNRVKPAEITPEDLEQIWET